MEFDFSVKVDSLDKVPEQFRPLFVQGEDKQFALGDGFKGVAEVVTGLNKAIKAERKNKPDLSGLSDFGTTADEIVTSVKTKITDLTKQLADKANVNPEKIKQEFAKQHGDEITKLTKRNEGLQAQLYQHLVDSRATAAIAENKGVPELVLPFVRNQIKVVEENGVFNVYVVDGAGDRRFNMAGQPLSVAELVREMRADPKYGRLFDADDTSGGGKPPKNPAKGAQSNSGELSSVQKISMGLKRGVSRGT